MFEWLPVEFTVYERCNPDWVLLKEMRPTENGHSVADSGWVEEVVDHLKSFLPYIVVPCF